MRAERAGSKVNWGGIISGTAVTLGLGWMFLIFGGVVGLVSVDLLDPVMEPELIGPSLNPQLSTWNWVYYFLSMVIAFFLGGYSSCKIALIAGRFRCAIYGLVTWAVATLLAFSVGCFLNPYLLEFFEGSSARTISALSFCILAFGAAGSAWGAILGGNAFQAPTQSLLDRSISPDVLPEGKTEARETEKYKDPDQPPRNHTRAA